MNNVQNGAPSTPPAAARLRQLLAQPGLRLMPCCFDALSARLIERAGFELTFLSGFAVSAARLAQPDRGLVSYSEMLDAGRSVVEAVSMPVLADADTGFGNEMNAARTIAGYAQAGLACAMIEDQVAPKRCGHTEGKAVVDRAAALLRVRAAVHAAEQTRLSGRGDILVMARTDANATHGFDEALWRLQAFADAGADIVFLEAPRDEREMERACRAVALPALANLIDGGKTPWLSPTQLESIGFKLAAYPLALISSVVAAMESALSQLRLGQPPSAAAPFSHVLDVVGFADYDARMAQLLAQAPIK